MENTLKSEETANVQKGRRRGRGGGNERVARKVDYHNLVNPFPPMKVFSDDRIEAMHEAALEVLENLGMKVLLPQARAVFKKGGARVDENSEMVFIGREMIEAALATAPKSIPVMAGSARRICCWLRTGWFSSQAQARLTRQTGSGAGVLARSAIIVNWYA